MLAREEVRLRILETTAAGEGVVVFLQDKLGGEISIPKTARSPELAFDITLVEIRRNRSGSLDISRYGILEVQTMDFHGSYRYAVKNLEDALRLHGAEFPHAVEENPRWLGEKVEGPNIANVFKRTSYQIMLKFQIGGQGNCAGCVLALPESVWESWQRHLGSPQLTRRPGGDYELKRPDSEGDLNSPAWIYVFDIDSRPEPTPSPIVIRKRIATDADSVAFYALKVAPAAAIAQGGSVDSIQGSLRRRLGI
jgi:hypothetical protein